VRHLFGGLYWFWLLSTLLLVCLIAILLGTPKGTAFLVHKGAEISGEKVAINGIKGTLLKGVSADKVTYSHDGFEVQLTDIVLKPLLHDLMSKKLRIHQIKANTVFIRRLSQKKNRNDALSREKLPEFSSPFSIQIDSLEVSQLNIQSGSKIQTYEDIRTSGSLQNSTLNIDHLHSRINTYSTDISGYITFHRPFPLSFKIDLSDKYDSSVHARLDGEAEHYQLIAAATSNKPSLPSFTAHLKSTGDINHLSIEQATAHLLNGSLTLSGDIDWKKKLQIHTTFSAQGINPGKLVSELPGKISLKGKASFTHQTLKTRFNANGQLRGTPLTFQSDLSLQRDNADIHNAKMSIGDNVVTIKGRVSYEQADNIRYRIHAANLSTLYPGLSGKLTGTGRLHGQWQKLKIVSKLKGESLSMMSQHIETLTMNIQSSEKSAESKLNFQAENILAVGQSIQSLSVKGRGKLKHHSLHFSLKDGPYGATLNANLNGQLDTAKMAWKSQLEKLRVSIPDLAEYQQEQPTTLLLSKEKQRISEFCLKGPIERLCMDGNINLHEKSLIKGYLQQLPLKRLGKWIPHSNSLTEHLGSEFRITGHNHLWKLSSRSKLDTHNYMDAQLSFERTKKTVEGKITAKFDKLQWITLFTETINQPQGRVNANIDISGSTAQPEFVGSIKLKEARARIPASGTELTNTNLLINLQAGQTAQLSGGITSGKGIINLNGSATWSQLPHWNADLAISGYNFQAINLPIARINVSPNILVKAGENDTTINGTLSIPNADIRLKNLSDNISKPSADEVIVGGLATKPESDSPALKLAINSDINVRLGTEVNLQGFGLNTRIEGTLKLRERPGKPINGDGTLTMVDGKYKALGQELVIEQGELYFNGPLDAPRMDLRIINPTKNPIKDVKVGLSITGPLQQPESHLFSTPPMPETEALAYLLTGKPFGATGESESGLLLNAAAKLGMKKSASKINRIRAKAGLDTLQLATDNDLTESELIIGKYLSSRLYLEYITKLFTDSEIFSLRYEFTDKLHLEAESGAKAQALDLIYQFEK
jgi:translocation and assembly module TamB